MRVLVAPDKFKSSLSADVAAVIMAEAILAVHPTAEIDLQPLADGGEGTMKTLTEALGGCITPCQSLDALGRPITSRFGWIEGSRTAVVEMAEASGLWRLTADERNPWLASTFGTGATMKAAMAHGASRVVLGLGGSATNDAGAGMAAALGFRFHNQTEVEVAPIPANFLKIKNVTPPALAVKAIVEGLSDVTSPLLGPLGATHVFGPQKGLQPDDAQRLEDAVCYFASVVERDLGVKVRVRPGAGAAGGLGFGLMAFCGAALRSGFDEIAECTGLEERVIACDIIVTAEGGMDRQTLHGKGPGSLAVMAKKHGKRRFAIAGQIADHAALAEIFHLVCPLSPTPLPFEESVARTPELLGITMRNIASLEIFKPM